MSERIEINGEWYVKEEEPSIAVYKEVCYKYVDDKYRFVYYMPSDSFYGYIEISELVESNKYKRFTYHSSFIKVLYRNLETELESQFEKCKPFIKWLVENEIV